MVDINQSRWDERCRLVPATKVAQWLSPRRHGCRQRLCEVDAMDDVQGWMGVLKKASSDWPAAARLPRVDSHVAARDRAPFDVRDRVERHLFGARHLYHKPR